MSLIDDGAAWLAGQLKAHASHAVTYTQGYATVSTKGTRSVEEVQHVDAEGLSTIVRQVFFVMTAADLGDIVPQRGDQIAETVGGRTRYWEAAPSASGSVWQYESAGEELIRVNVVEVE